MHFRVDTDPAPLAVDADGVVRVGGTRVTLETVVATFQAGYTAEGIVEQYPSLKLGDVYAVIAYYLRHQPDVDAYLRERRQQADDVRKQNEQRFNPVGVRERLLARQRQQG